MSGDFYEAGEVVTFTNVLDHPAVINGRKVDSGDSILVELARDLNFATEDGTGAGGAWGWGGYTARWIKARAWVIRLAEDDSCVLYRAPGKEA